MLEPPLSTAELAEVEAQIGAELPGEYRSFLLQVSRGGAGPAYGLFPLRRVGGRWRWEGDGADLTDWARLGEAFPHSEAFNPVEGMPEPPDDEEAEDDYWAEHDRLMEEATDFGGLLYLCHLGCAYREALVVSGPRRGVMWADQTADGDGFTPMRDDDGSPLGFARWFRRWLDNSEHVVAAKT